MRGIIAAVILLAATTAHAQVFNCTNERGQKIFSDRPCAAVGGEGRQVQRARTFDEVVDERIRAADATAEKRERRFREAVNEQSTRQQEYEQAIQSAPAPRHKGYAERLAERNAGVKSNLTTQPSVPGVGHRANNYENTRLTDRDPRKSDAENLAARNAGVKSVFDRPLTRAERGLPPLPSSNNAAPQAPTNQGPIQMTNCAGGFCHDTNGGVYHQHGNGKTMTGPNGQTCVRTGPVVECH